MMAQIQGGNFNLKKATERVVDSIKDQQPMDLMAQIRKFKDDGKLKSKDERVLVESERFKEIRKEDPKAVTTEDVLGDVLHIIKENNKKVGYSSDESSEDSDSDSWDSD